MFLKWYFLRQNSPLLGYGATLESVAMYFSRCSVCLLVCCKAVATVFWVVSRVLLTGPS